FILEFIKFFQVVVLKTYLVNEVYQVGM
ncbi:MAG: hypothetical protein ACI82Q_002948, partial [Nonlabens sp.]